MRIYANICHPDNGAILSCRKCESRDSSASNNRFIWLFLIFLITSGCLFSSCIDPISQKRHYWKNHIDSLNNVCPLNIDNVISMTGAKWYHDTIEVEYKVNEDYYPISIIEKAYRQNKNDIKKTRFLSIEESLIDSVHPINDLLLMNTCIKEHITGSKSYRGFNIIIESNDIRKFSQVDYTEEERNFMRLKNKTIGESCRCPYEIDYGMVMENVSLNREYVTFQIIVDESIYPIEIFRSSVEEMRQILREELFSSPSVVLYGDMLAISKCNLGVRYMYVGNSSGESVTITLNKEDLPSIDEIQKVVDDNRNVNINNH